MGKTKKKIILIVVCCAFICVLALTFFLNKGKEADSISTNQTTTSEKEEGNVNMVIPSGSTIAIHDPSVFYDPISEVYYSYGSHMVAGKSYDLVSWTYIANSNTGYSVSNQLFSKYYLDEFSEVYSWLGSNVTEGIWAVDVIYSEDAAEEGNDPYFMYVTVVNGSYKSAICLATSSSPEGPFSYQGMIVCSDFSIDDVASTNLLEVMSVSNTNDLNSQNKSLYFKPLSYSGTSSEWYKANLPDAIDPAPFYDSEGNLYMTYGSFTTAGGIRILKLNSKTGLRSMSNYQYKSDGSQDEYFGRKIANNYGEGPYVLKVKNIKSSTGYYYYLFYSQGNLRSTGGYNMRMFRSEYPDKDYKDMAGNSALSTSVNKEALGVRVMDNFKFSTMSNASMSNGGNSAIVTSDEKIFLHYHSKSSDGTEGFIVKSNMLIENQDGWLVSTPYKNSGEAYVDISKEEIFGQYEFIYHRLEFYKDPSDYKLNYVKSESITLNEDMTISGAYQGTWTYDNNNITLMIGKNKYIGKVLKQMTEGNVHTETVVFAAAGADNRTVWGSKYEKDDLTCVENDINGTAMLKEVEKQFEVSTYGQFGSMIKWETSDSDILTIGESDGKSAVISVAAIEEDKEVTLKATFSKGSESRQEEYRILIKSVDALGAVHSILDSLESRQGDYCVAQYSFDGEGIGFNTIENHSDAYVGGEKVPVIAEGNRGKGLQFDGNGVLYLPTGFYGLSTGMTVAMKIYINAGFEEDMTLLSIGKEEKALELRVNKEGKIGLYYGSGSAVSSTRVTLGEWNSISFRCNEDGGNIRIIINDLKEQKTLSIGSLTNILKSSKVFVGSSLTNGGGFKGTIDDIYIMNNLITESNMFKLGE